MLETLLLLIQIRRQKTEFLRTLILVQATVEPRSEALARLMEEYKKACFPFAEAGVRQQTQKAKKIMDWFTKQGPLVIQASPPPTGRVKQALDRQIKP